MKKITLVLLALCLAAALLFLVACNGGSGDTTVEGGDDVTVEPDTQGGEDVSETADPEDESFISVVPSDDDEQWGDLVTSAN